MRVDGCGSFGDGGIGFDDNEHIVECTNGCLFDICDRCGNGIEHIVERVDGVLSKGYASIFGFEEPTCVAERCEVSLEMRDVGCGSFGDGGIGFYDIVRIFVYTNDYLSGTAGGCGNGIEHIVARVDDVLDTGFVAIVGSG